MDQETPYTVKEVAELTGFSPQTVTKMFENEPGVIVYEEKRPRKLASYRTIRIPRHVYRRVMAKWTVQ
jgi:DNA-binding LacI/PurR family transcriptional regulator